MQTAPAIIVHQSPPQYITRDFRQDPICATNEQQIFQSKLKLQVNNKSLSTNLKFRDCKSGKVVYKVEGKVFSLKDKKVLKGEGGTGPTILTISKEPLSLVQVYKITGQTTNQEICKIAVERTALKAKLHVNFVDVNGRGTERKIMVKANLERKRCCIYLIEESLIPMATMELMEVKQQTLLGDESYMVEIEPGIDAALITALCVAVIEENLNYRPAFGATSH